jgi:transposase
VAGFPLRRPAVGVHRRERVPYFHGAPQSEGSQGRAGLRRGSEEPGQEPDTHSLAHPRRRDGRGALHRGFDRRGTLRGLRGGVLGPDVEGRAGGGARRALGAHRSGRVRELIESRDANLLFLPSYSPDLNPIEEAFSKIKNIVRKAAARTRETLDEAISEAMYAIKLEDVAGWFSHCGYEPQDQYS